MLNAYCAVCPDKRRVQVLLNDAQRIREAMEHIREKARSQGATFHDPHRQAHSRGVSPRSLCEIHHHARCGQCPLSAQAIRQANACGEHIAETALQLHSLVQSGCTGFDWVRSEAFRVLAGHYPKAAAMFR